MQNLLIKEQFTFYGDGEQTRDFVYIDDLVSAIWTVLYSKDTNGVYSMLELEAKHLLILF